MIFRTTDRIEYRRKPATVAGRVVLCIVSLTALCLAAAPALAHGGGNGKSNYCSLTASNQRVACKDEIRDDLFNGKAICLNISDDDDRSDCYEEVSDTFDEENDLCSDQFDARRDLCGEIGEARYDPDFSAGAFDPNPKNPALPNPYFPLAVGDEWDFEGGDEAIHVSVKDATKLIDGVTCIVARDTVMVDRELHEDTDDWYGFANNGDVYYCGEQTAEYETFPGDDPQDAEQVGIEGAWKAGRDGAKAGIQFPANPAVGDVYRQEWAPGDAEDVAKVLSTDYDYADGGELNEYVPQDLAEHLCDHDCIVTGEYTPIDPDPESYERKYYAPGIGVFLEVSPATGDSVQLVSCSLSSDLGKCGTLP